MDKRVSLGERVSQCAEVHRTPSQYISRGNGILRRKSHKEGLTRLFALASRGVGEKGETGEETFNPQQYREKSQGGGERRAKRGDQAYAPFGAGRETGHQVPVVAAKIESDR